MREMIFGGRAVLTEAVPTGMQKMAGMMWAPMLLMGLMIVFASLGLSVVKANFASDYFGVEKGIREAADAPAYLIDKRQFIESVNVWLPGLPLLGIGLILSAITFSLANILGVFRAGGVQIQQAFGKEPQTLTPTITAKLFPMLMMMGLMILIGALVVSIVIAITAGDVFGNAISEINAAESGSDLLGDLQTVKTYGAWLQAFAFTGLALVLSGIVLALYTIAQALRFQHGRIAAMARGAE